MRRYFGSILPFKFFPKNSLSVDQSASYRNVFKLPAKCRLRDTLTSFRNVSRLDVAGGIS